MPTVIGRNKLTWRHRQGRWSLHLGAGRPLAVVVPDAVHPGMWRVRCGARLSGMVNLARAKDAAETATLAILNRQSEGQETGLGAPYSDFSAEEAWR